MRYIAVEGPIGVGKTALAEKLAERLSAKLVLEEVDENPFLDRFYDDMGAYAFQTQMFFLLSRHRQQQSLREPDLFAGTLVSDYVFEKDFVFATVTLSEHELALYERIYKLLAQEAVRPDVLVYLQARTEVLLSRIRQRNRPYEAGIDPEYVEAVADAYNHHFLHYDAAPLLIVNTEQLDFVRSREDFDDLFRAIETTTSGRKFYSPRGKNR
ncbi:MAG: deoxynucleoside kinase [candidate division WOR-3 bacterium]